MAELVERFDHPPLSEPVLIVALEGWIDAGQAAGTAIRSLLNTQDTELVARFDTDQLLDHRARRPLLTLNDGLITELRWPAIELLATTDDDGRHCMFLVGAEPDHGWGRFLGAVQSLAQEFEVRSVVGLGAYPAAVPHTRSTMLALTTPSKEVQAALPDFIRGSVMVPAGMQTALEVALFERGLPTMGLWAQVPHYISGMEFAAGALALIEGLTRVVGLRFPTGDLKAEVTRSTAQINELIAANPEHGEMIHQLEELFDQQEFNAIGPLPTGDELAAELQAFLRDQQG